jgi:glycosyltransferase involved in cell wall biosynthesis
MNVLFAPDWQEGNPYQSLLAAALERHDVHVDFLEGYKRLLPLSRLLAGRRFDIFHLHWPEAYAPLKGDGWDWFRSARFSVDLAAAVRNRVLVATAHNLVWHNRAHEAFIDVNVRSVFRRAKATFAHSAGARDILVRQFALASERVPVIPHGDLSSSFGPPIEAHRARQELAIGDQKVALAFGAVEPYKGLEHVISWWKSRGPANVVLAIVGKPLDQGYAAHVSALAANASNVLVRLDRQSDAALRQWLSVASVAIFKYQRIFTSGAANLARSYGIPLLIPAAADTVALGEPTPYVHRFISMDDFGQALSAALAIAPDFAAAAVWRAACSWDVVARQTADAYVKALSSD